MSDVIEAATAFALTRVHPSSTYGKQVQIDAFLAGAAWQREQDANIIQNHEHGGSNRRLQLLTELAKKVRSKQEGEAK